MKLYFPESKNQVDYCGYNNLVRMFRKALGRYVTDTPEGADFRVYCNLPWHHAPKELKAGGLPLIVYTMYESTKVPSGWVSFLNKHADVVLVPSEWTASVFIDSGVKAPILILSGCYDDEDVVPVVKSREMDKYVFIWQGVALDAGGRKGADIAYKAFTELRKSGDLKDDARLIMKYRPYEHTELVMDGVETSLGVKYLQANLSRDEMTALYESVDCCINPTHGEGFGLIPLEQMGMGKPVVVTGWSMDYLKDAPHIPIEYELKTSPVTWNHKHVRVNLNGIAFNVGGLVHEYHWLPGAMHYIPDGSEVKIKGLEDGAPELSFAGKIKGRIHNAVADIQKKTRLALDPRRRPITLYQENPGMDAWADVRDLQDSMLWAYHNREEAFQLGFDAGVWASHHMGLFRMREDFEAIKSILYRIANNKKEACK